MSHKLQFLAAALGLIFTLTASAHAWDHVTYRVDSTTIISGDTCFASSFWGDDTLIVIHFNQLLNDTIYWRGAQEPGHPPVYGNYVSSPDSPTVGTWWWGHYAYTCSVKVVDYSWIEVPAGTFQTYTYHYIDSTTGAFIGSQMLSPDIGSVAGLQILEGDTVVKIVQDSCTIVGGIGIMPMAIGNTWYMSEGLPDSGQPPGVKIVTQNVPQLYLLHPNHPNPFNPSTVTSYELRVPSYVNLDVFSISGAWITTLAEGWKAAGVHEALFDGSGLPSGMYLARLQARDYTAMQKLVLLK